METISRKAAIEKGLKRYFTGIPCKNGHISERGTANSNCLQCRRKPPSKTKKCTSCNKILLKNKENFRFKNKSKGVLTFRSMCRVCERNENKSYHKTDKGKSSKSKRDKKWAKSGGKAISDSQYYKKNKPILIEKMVERRRLKRKTDLNVIVTDRIGSNLRNSLRSKNYNKRIKTKEALGCSIKEFVSYFNTLFDCFNNENIFYSWENISEWDYDHIVPISYFEKNYDYGNDIYIQKICWHWSNLQPLFSKTNRNLKKDKIDPVFAETKIAFIKSILDS